MQWTIEGTDGLTGPYPLLCESRQALTEAIEEWVRPKLDYSVLEWCEWPANRANSRNRRPEAIASNMVAKDIE